MKGSLTLNKAAYAKAMKENFNALLSNEIIDMDITRIGGPIENDNSVKCP